MIVRSLFAFVGLALVSISMGKAAELSAKDLASALAERQEGSAYMRLRLQVKSSENAAEETLQIQIKERRTKTTTDLVYQVLWPQQRKGESVLLHQAVGHSATGSGFTPPDKLQTLSSSQLREPLFGSDLLYLDVIEDPFSWQNQSIAGTEAVNGVSCTILESKPGKGESEYSKVRSWIDTNRLVPLRIEKYAASGDLKLQIETTRVGNDDKGRPIPANLVVRDPKKGSVTELDGSRIKHNVTFNDAEFAPEGLKQISAPTSGGAE